jgi:hypothetical protein
MYYIIAEYDVGHLPESEPSWAADWSGAMTLVEEIEDRLEAEGYYFVDCRVRPDEEYSATFVGTRAGMPPREVRATQAGD